LVRQASRFKTDDYGSTFWWKDENGKDCSTQWSPFAADTSYFAPSEKQFMQNFRVNDLENLLKKLSDEGVTFIGKWRLMIMENLVGY
jgi:cytochrome b involved in lipid metabolism